MSETISITCPKCGEPYTVPASSSGKAGTCWQCGTGFTMTEPIPPRTWQTGSRLFALGVVVLGVLLLMQWRARDANPEMERFEQRGGGGGFIAVQTPIGGFVAVGGGR